MATRVQDAEIFATNFTTQTRTLNGVGAGNLIAASAVYGVATITFTISDNNSGSYSTPSPVNPFTQSSPALRGYIWYAANHASGNTTITWTPSASVSGLVGCVEYSGLATSSPVEDADGAYNANTTSHATPTLTRTKGGAIYAATQSSSNATWTAGTNFTDLGTGGSARGFHESAEVGSGDRTASATSAANEDAIIIAVAFKNAETLTGRITAADADVTYTEVTGRVTAADLDTTYTEITARITAADADMTWFENTGKITAADADVTYTEVTGRITAADAEITYTEEAGVVSGRITAADADVTYTEVTGRITAADADTTYTELTGRITAADADVTWFENTARITAVDADITYTEDIVTARIVASDLLVAYSTESPAWSSDAVRRVPDEEAAPDYPLNLIIQHQEPPRLESEGNPPVAPGRFSDWDGKNPFMKPGE